MNPSYLFFYSIALFSVGTFGLFFNFRNLITMLMCIELMLLSININLIIGSITHSTIISQVFILFVIAIAAAESAIGLAVIIIYYRIRNNLDITFTNLMKG